MVYSIVKFPEAVLASPAQIVNEFGTPELRLLIADMFESMYAANGVGLAAPQIGIPRRIAVVDCSAGEDLTQQLVLLNPEIVHRGGRQTGEEGCLSVPGFRADVTRAMTAVVRAQDIDGNWFEKSGTELLARALQHETDHLNGTLFLSHLSVLKRDLIKRRIRKLQRDGEW